MTGRVLYVIACVVVPVAWGVAVVALSNLIERRLRRRGHRPRAPMYHI